jgi:nicotinamidase-related amidase
MLSADRSFFLLVDMQGKLASLVQKHNELTESIVTLIRGLRILEIPTVWMEQYPKGLGETIPKIKGELEGVTPFAKTSFGCGGDEAIMAAITSHGRKQAIVAGIETHVCVYQSCMQLLEGGFEVTLVEDCTSSRSKKDRKTALRALSAAGVKMSTVEMVLFELLHKAGGERFNLISSLIK